MGRDVLFERIAPATYALQSIRLHYNKLGAGGAVAPEADGATGEGGEEGGEGIVLKKEDGGKAEVGPSVKEEGGDGNGDGSPGQEDKASVEDEDDEDEDDDEEEEVGVSPLLPFLA
jgi:hypothetical protein